MPTASEAHARVDAIKELGCTEEEVNMGVTVLTSGWITKNGIPALEDITTLALMAILRAKNSFQYRRPFNSELDELLLAQLKRHLENDYGYKVTVDTDLLGYVGFTVEF